MAAKPAIQAGNLLNVAGLPTDPACEHFEALLDVSGCQVERIVSKGHATPAGAWYDQDWDEWVMLASGAASLQIEGEASPRNLQPGDYLWLPAHCRHRVEWTDPERETVWLALHIRRAAPS